AWTVRGTTYILFFDGTRKSSASSRTQNPTPSHSAGCCLRHGSSDLGQSEPVSRPLSDTARASKGLLSALPSSREQCQVSTLLHPLDRSTKLLLVLTSSPKILLSCCTQLIVSTSWGCTARCR